MAPSDRLHVTVVLKNGSAVGDVQLPAAATAGELKQLIAVADGGAAPQDGLTPKFQVALPAEAPRQQRRTAQQPDLTQLLLDSGDYGRYVAWREEYRPWREGRAKGAQGWAGGGGGPSGAAAQVWRDGYRAWRLGRPRGAEGETAKASARPLKKLKAQHAGATGAARVCSKIDSVPAVVFDIVAAEDTSCPALVPVDGPAVAPIPVDEFPPDALVTVRVFRFFEDRADEGQAWEQELQNVNSGSLLWLPIQLCPGMHSVRGAKYGTWFTIHYLQVLAKHFRSAYHMANEGACAARTFGSSTATTSTVSGKPLAGGYFWYVSPAGQGDGGWQHLCRAGPYDGNLFMTEWRTHNSSLDTRALQTVLDTVCQ